MTTTKRRGHGEGSIFERKDGLWVARLTLDGGKRKDFYAKTRREAAAKLKEAQKAVDDGLSLDTDRQTVAQFLDKWLSASVKPSTRHKTFTTYESLCRTSIVPRIGTKKLAKLTALDLQALYTELADSGLSPRTVHHVHRVLHRAFTQAVRWNLIARNPCDGAQGPRVARAEMKVWTPEEADTFLCRHGRASDARPVCVGADQWHAARRTLGVEMERYQLESGNSRGAAGTPVATWYRVGVGRAKNSPLSSHYPPCPEGSRRAPCPQRPASI